MVKGDIVKKPILEFNFIKQLNERESRVEEPGNFTEDHCEVLEPNQNPDNHCVLVPPR